MRKAAGIMTIIAGLVSSIAPYSFVQDMAWRLTDSPEAANSFIMTWMPLVVFSTIVILVLTIEGGINALAKNAWGWALAGAICSMIAGAFVMYLVALLGLLALIFLAIRKGEFEVEEQEEEEEGEKGEQV